jgi:hypothetical protein
MAFNQIQFQHGMSIPEFMSSFGTEERCAEGSANRALATGLSLPAL